MLWCLHTYSYCLRTFFRFHTTRFTVIMAWLTRLQRIMGHPLSSVCANVCHSPWLLTCTYFCEGHVADSPSWRFLLLMEAYIYILDILCSINAKTLILRCIFFSLKHAHVSKLARAHVRFSVKHTLEPLHLAYLVCVEPHLALLRFPGSSLPVSTHSYDSWNWKYKHGLGYQRMLV